MIKSLFLLVLIGFSFLSHGQGILEKRIDFEVDQIPINQALDILSDKCGIDVAYSKNFFKYADLVSLSVKQETVANILNHLLKNTDIVYKTQGESRLLLFKQKVEYQTISGYIQDNENGERIVGARIVCKNYNSGAISNEFGFFTFKAPIVSTEISTISIVVRSIGFKPKLLSIKSPVQTPIIVNMLPADDLPTVVIDGREKIEELEYSSVSVDPDNITEISMRLVKLSPSLSGQADILRTAQLLPGIQGQTDGFGGTNIRGGESGQNLLIMDGSPIYIPYHLLGLYSIYNTETVKSIKVIKGNFPARYGGAVSSILDIQIREGDLYKWKGSAQINLLGAGATIEGPLKKGKGSILFAGRISPNARFFHSTMGRLYFENEYDSLSTKFYDYNIKANYIISKKDRLYLSLFSGKDLVTQNSLNRFNEGIETFSFFDLEWKNTIGTLRWNHLFSKKLFLNTIINYSNYSHRFSSQRELEFADSISYKYQLSVIDNRSDNVDIGIKTDFDYLLAKKHKLRFGLHYNYRDFTPNFFSFQEYFSIDNGLFGSEIFDYNAYYESRSNPKYLIHEFAAYIEDQIKLRRWYFNIGLRGSGYFHESSQFINLEPRFLAKYNFTEKLTATLALNKRVQYLHLIANQTIQFPNDLWLPSTEKIQPQELYEAEASVQYQFNNRLKFNLSGYYRQTLNMYSYPETFDFLYDSLDYSDYNYLLKGMGKSKGIEFFMNYANHKMGVLLSYSLSETVRIFDSLNLGKPFHTNFDSRHQIKLALHYNLSTAFKVGFNWVYNSPKPKINVVEFASTGAFSNVDVDPPGFKNTTRVDPYSRLDLNLSFYHKGKKIEHLINVGIYNVLNTRNVAFYQAYQVIDGKVISDPLVSLPILPTFSYRISF